VLLDKNPEYIALAQERIQSEPHHIQSRLLDCIVGDIRDLSSFERSRFDSVLCLGGPLTQISDDAERVTATKELVRVAKPGALVFLSVAGHLAMLRTVLCKASDELIVPRYWELIKQGEGNNFVGGSLWHFFRAEELRQLAESCGLTTLQMAGCEGLSTGQPEATNALAEEETKWARWVEMVLSTSAEPAIVDMAEHMLYIGHT
jgi:ubiquinone/menaquinone biosynthesis C-methylase UbiE